MSPVNHDLTIPIEHAGSRLDQALASLLTEYSRTRIKDWIETGQVLVDGVRRAPKDRVAGGERVQVTAVMATPDQVAPEAIALSVVHADPEVFVINKPAGLVVHPGAGNADGTLQNALLHLDPNLAELPRAGIVHRLDKGTTGLLVIARTPAAHRTLVRAIESRHVHREYEAVCIGTMTAGGTVEAPIGRHPVDRKRMTVRSDGREAVTHYRVLARFRAHTHVRVVLETGRTHQIRLHLSHIGYPLVGDAAYGARLRVPKQAAPTLLEVLRGFNRQALHARRLEFKHPASRKLISVEAPLPADMLELIAHLAADTAGHPA
jgi:23S rRNA pseudouridine1911/1915/1917 synthase